MCEVPLLEARAGEPGHVETGAQNDHPIGGVQRPGTEPLLVGWTEPHRHKHFVGTAARVAGLSAGRVDRDPASRPRGATGLRRSVGTCVVPDEENPRTGGDGGTGIVCHSRPPGAGYGSRRRRLRRRSAHDLADYGAQTCQSDSCTCSGSMLDAAIYWQGSAGAPQVEHFDNGIGGGLA